MSRLDSHVSSVQRKLAVVTFVEWLAMSAFVLAVLAFVVVLADKALHIGVSRMFLWVGLGAIVVVAMVMAGVYWPSRSTAAVKIDERLNLKEKFSTALHVRGMNDPFARAVVKDAEQTADKVRLAGQFPVQFPRIGYVAMGVAVLSLCAWKFVPNMDLLGRQKQQEAKKQEELQIEQTKNQVKEALAKIEQLPPALQTDEGVRVARKELEEVLKDRHPEPAKAARRVVESLSKADEALKNQIKNNQAFAQAQKNEMMFKGMNPPIEAKGPVAETQRALAKGDFEKPLEEIKKLGDEFKKMNEEEKKQAADQMQKMAEALKQIANDPRAQQKLQDQMKQMGINQQQIQQAQQMMQKAAAGDKQAQQQMQQMQQQLQQQLAQQMQQQGANQQQIQQMQQQLQQAMQQAQQAANAQQQAAQMAQGAQQMAQAMQQQGQQGGQQQMADGQQAMQQALEQMQAMQQDLQRAQNAQQQMQQQMAQAGGQCNGDGQGQGQKDGPGNTGQWKAGDPDGKRGNGQGGPGQGAGGNMGKQGAAFGTKEENSPSQYDEKGKHLASVFVKDRSIKGESRAQLEEIIKAGRADEADDVDDTRADRRAQEVQKKYFQVMEGQLKK
jgi:hypothetical protein